MQGLGAKEMTVIDVKSKSFLLYRNDPVYRYIVEKIVDILRHENYEVDDLIDAIHIAEIEIAKDYYATTE
jgi:hypothetical protein